MFSGRPLIRFLGDTGRFIRHPMCSMYNGATGRNDSNKVTWAVTRCYSKDTKNSRREATKSDEKNNAVENEESVEILDLEKEKEKEIAMPGDLSRYKVFKDEDSPIILDVEEERLASGLRSDSVLTERNEFDDISLERGVRGVFDIEELVSVLKAQGVMETAVIKVPDTLGYADHMVITSGKSSRHMLATAEYVRRLFKKKMLEGDKVPIIEGKKNKNEDWFALDLGNIILHLFSQSTRKTYDLESLWALGPEFDPHLNRPQNSLDDIIKKHSLYLEDLQPADAKQ